MKTKKSSHITPPKLCGPCLRRQGLPKSKIGRSIAKASKAQECEICGGRLGQLNSVAELVAEQLSSYEFESFLVGTSVPPSLLNREDEIRSSLRVRGREGLKTQITRTICKKVSRITGKRVDYLRPDLTILVPLGGEPVSITPRSIWVSARYLKRERSIPQRSKICSVCNGLGCASCDFRGNSANSIQSMATEFFMSAFEAESCNFIWIGGEDDNSLVLGSGRPFFVEIVRPRKRKSFSSIQTSESKNLSREIEFRAIEILPSKPTKIPMFKMECEVHLLKKIQGDSTSGNPAPVDVASLQKEFSGFRVSVQVSRKFKRVSKFIESTEVTREDERGLTLRIKCDGGIPIKKLIGSSDGSVTPNLSGYLENYKIDESMPFDVLDVVLVQDGQLARRVQKKDQSSSNRRREKYNRNQEPTAAQISVDEESEMLEAMSGF